MVPKSSFIYAVPSKGRIGGVRTLDVLKRNVVLFVPEREREEYERVYGERCEMVVGVPDEVRGITRTRNWILRECGTTRVVMVDDDVMKCGYHKVHHERMMVREDVDWDGECERLFEVTEGLGWKIWGIATQGAPRSWYTYRPLLFHSYVTASFMGIVNDGWVKFDEEFPVKEDYEICLRHIREFGGVMAARYLYWQNFHWDNEGGCKSYRTVMVEEKAVKDLMRMYPGMIRRVVRGGTEWSIELEF